MISSAKTKVAIVFFAATLAHVAYLHYSICKLNGYLVSARRESAACEERTSYLSSSNTALRSQINEANARIELRLKEAKASAERAVAAARKELEKDIEKKPVDAKEFNQWLKHLF